MTSPSLSDEPSATDRPAARPSQQSRRARRQAANLTRATVQLERLERLQGTPFGESEAHLNGVRQLIPRGGQTRRNLARTRKAQ